MIRYARVADLPELMSLGKRLHGQTVYADIDIDLQTCAQTLGQCISNAFGFAMVAVHDDKITGFMMGAAVPLWFSRKRCASDIITYAESPGDGYRLIRKFVEWAWAIPNVVEITLAQSSGIDTDRVGVLYKRVGLQQVGSIYTAARPVVSVEDAA